jgi:hypothetical protein
LAIIQEVNMKVYILIVDILCMSLAAVSVVLLQPSEAKPLTEIVQNEPDNLPLQGYLVRLGNNFNCFFTIEEAQTDGKQPGGIEAHFIPISSDKGGLHKELEHLLRTVPNFTYEVNRANPQIIHVKDRRLMQQEEYGLDSILKSIDFTGNVNDLPSVIGKQGLLVLPPPVRFKH